VFFLYKRGTGVYNIMVYSHYCEARCSKGLTNMILPATIHRQTDRQTLAASIWGSVKTEYSITTGAFLA
jgi:hypothetical protein